MNENASPGFRHFVRDSGLDYYEHWSLPQATQILRHSEFAEVPRVGIGDLPDSLPDGWIGHFELQEVRGNVITVVVVSMPATITFAVRMICHDRSVPERLRRNPEADQQIVELSDRDVKLESDAFLRRYFVAADHDQDPTRVWQIFSPEVIDYLTEGAPEGFSFELQQGALCCFVPQQLDDPSALGELCRAARLVYDRVAEISAAGPASDGSAVKDSRDSLVDEALAEHPFSEPPTSIWAAARHFGGVGLVGGRSWKLGAEAFFRAYAESIGFQPRSEAEFRAGHIEACVIGQLTHIAQGRYDDIPCDAWIVLSVDDTSSWMTLVVDGGSERNLYSFAGLPETERLKQKEEIDVIADYAALYVWTAKKGKSKKAIDGFLALAHPFAADIIRRGTYS